jgi:outer membrane lipoprotein-sorting protein
MRLGDKLSAALVLTTIALVIFTAASCRNSAKPPTLEANFAPTSEPETYTATIVRSIEDGEQSEISETQVARLGDMRREEWTEKGERLAFITRFDSGKSFYLNLSKQTYIETDLPRIAVEKTKSANEVQNSNDAEKQRSDAREQTSAMDFVEDNFAESATSLDSRALPDEYIANQLCKVVEKRLSFADGRTEVTKIFRTERFSNLAIKTEMETISQNHRVKVVTEWRNIKLDASPEDFVVPANFKKVQSFSAP